MSKRGLFKKMMKLSIMPMLVLGIIVMIFCYYRFTNTLYDEARDTMRNISKAVSLNYDERFPGNYYLVKGAGNKYDLYKGDANITSDYSIVDVFKEITGMEISLLYMDMRINTTFATESGNRLAGLSTNPKTSETVLAGSEAFYNNVSVLDDKYLVLYTPLYNGDGSVVGMIEIARNEKDIRKDVWNAVWPILLLIVLGSALAATYSTKQAREITGVISKLQAFMNKVAGGSLVVDMDSSLAKREDELGDISKAAVSMQKSIRGFVGTDALTGLNNRRYVQDSYSRLLERHKETGIPFSIAIADIDFFKKVNDTYGHNAGDEVLKAVAAILKNAMIGNGFAARWGGEEFILIFDKSDSNKSADVLKKALDTIRNTVIETEEYQIKVTLTFGVVDGTNTDLETLVDAADAKLYYGKEHGKNQVVWDANA